MLRGRVVNYNLAWIARIHHQNQALDCTNYTGGLELRT